MLNEKKIMRIEKVTITAINCPPPKLVRGKS